MCVCVLTLVKQRRTHTARKLCGLPRCVATCPTPGPIEADNESPAPLPKESCAGFGKILYRGCGSALVEPSLRELALLPLPQNLGSILETSRPQLTAAARRSGSAGAGPLKVCVCFFIYISVRTHHCASPPIERDLKRGFVSITLSQCCFGSRPINIVHHSNRIAAKFSLSLYLLATISGSKQSRPVVLLFAGGPTSWTSCTFQCEKSLSFFYLFRIRQHTCSILLQSTSSLVSLSIPGVCSRDRTL